MAAAKFHKLEPMGARPAAEPQGVVSAIVKVREAGYRPPNVSIRSEMGPFIFTAEFPSDALAFLEADPKISSISLARPIPLQKLPQG